MGAGLGLIGSAMAGAAVGAGEVGKEGLEFAKQSTLNDQLAELTKARDARLEEAAAARDQRNFAHQEGMQDRGFQHTETMQGKQFDFSRGESALQRDFTSQENRLNRELQKNLHNDSLKVQLAHVAIAREQLQLSKDQTTLQPLGDGSFMKIRRDGSSGGQLTDLSGNVVYGGKDISASTKALMDGNNVLMRGLESEISKEMLPDEKAKIRQRIEALQAENRRLAGVAGPAPGAMTPDASDIARLKKVGNDPAMRAKFDEFYGAGAAAKVLNPPPAAAAATPAAASPIVRPTAGGGSAPDAPANGDATQPGGILRQAMENLGVDEGAGQDADRAKMAIAAALHKLQGYGIQQRRADPQGFAAVQRELAEAEASFRSAMARYQKAAPAATMTPRKF